MCLWYRAQLIHGLSHRLPLVVQYYCIHWMLSCQYHRSFLEEKPQTFKLWGRSYATPVLTALSWLWCGLFARGWGILQLCPSIINIACMIICGRSWYIVNGKAILFLCVKMQIPLPIKFVSLFFHFLLNTIDFSFLQNKLMFLLFIFTNYVFSIPIFHKNQYIFCLIQTIHTLTACRYGLMLSEKSPILNWTQSSWWTCFLSHFHSL